MSSELKVVLEECDLGGRNLTVLADVYPKALKVFSQLDPVRREAVTRLIKRFARAKLVRSLDELFDGALCSATFEDVLQYSSMSVFRLREDGSSRLCTVKPARYLKRYTCGCPFRLGATTKPNGEEFCRHKLRVFIFRSG